MSSILADVPSYMSPNAGGGGSCRVMSTDVQRSPNKLRRSNSIWAAGKIVNTNYSKMRILKKFTSTGCLFLKLLLSSLPLR
jgi:hypothetical protein